MSTITIQLQVPSSMKGIFKENEKISPEEIIDRIDQSYIYYDVNKSVEEFKEILNKNIKW